MSVHNGSTARLTLLMCAAEVLGMTSLAAYPSFLTELSALWSLSGAEAGFIGGAFFFGYKVRELLSPTALPTSLFPWPRRCSTWSSPSSAPSSAGNPG